MSIFQKANRQFELERKKNVRKFGIYITFLMFLFLLIIGYIFRYDIRLFFLLHNKNYALEISQAAKKNNIDPLLIKAVIIKESKFDKNCVGKAGEVGLMQIMPNFAAKDWSSKKKTTPLTRGQLAIPEINIEVGSWYLATRLKKWQKYKRALELALCEYNAGTKRANRWKPKDYSGEVIQNITIKQTKNYVKDVIRYYQKLKKMEK